MSSDTHTNRFMKIFEIIRDMFKYYDPVCFTYGKPEIIQSAKDKARQYTNELDILTEYDIDIIRKAVNLTVKDNPDKNLREFVIYKVPVIQEIISYCKKMSYKSEPKEKIREPQSRVDWEKLAAEGNPFAKNHLKWINRNV